ncbi:MAG TPA: bacteriohemerythrin [Geothrix sp.]|nr:bacteriohemerythrin [Geothrix sp.]
MSVLVWNPDWETGIRIVDDQHRELFRRIEQLMAAVHDGQAQALVPAAMAFLAQYVDQHFRSEELEMEGSGYPGFAAHRAIHEDMRGHVAHLLELCRSDPSAVIDPMIDFMTDWLIQHINSEDRRMARYLHAASGPPGALA